MADLADKYNDNKARYLAMLVVQNMYNKNLGLTYERVMAENKMIKGISAGCALILPRRDTFYLWTKSISRDYYIHLQYDESYLLHHLLHPEKRHGS